MGYLTYVSPEVYEIFKHALSYDFSKDTKLTNSWIDAITNLRVQENDKKLEDHMLKLAEIWQEHAFQSIHENRVKDSALNVYMVVMKCICKAGLYHDINGDLRPIWLKFIENIDLLE